MARKTITWLSAGMMLIVLLISGRLVSRVYSGAVSRGPAQSAAEAGIQAVPGCEDDPVALQAIGSAVEAALAQSELDEAGHAWRVHSVCRQGDWAYAFVKNYSSSTGEPLHTHSEIALAQLRDEGWKAILPDNVSEYNRGLAALPRSLLPDRVKAMLTRSQASALAALRYSDYALPWPAGESAFVIKHWYPAVDFSIGADGQTGTVRNAKAGTAVFVKRSSTRECGDPPPDWVCWQWANAVVLQVAPGEYAWYLHMAPNTIPEWIQEGVYVPAGSDLGQEGATGWAAGPHVHFMVASTYSCCVGSGDSRIPDWPFWTTYRVDFSEYAWEQLPYQAVSQNASADTTPPELPPGEAEPTSPPAEVAAPPPGPTPAPPSGETDAVSGCPNPYIVQAGQWLLKIATECRVDLSAIVAANPGLNPDRIYVGQSLTIPGGAAGAVSATSAPPEPPPADAPPPASGSACSGTHTVAPGENLFRIALNCGLTTAQMAAVNGIADPYIIYAGQVLRFP